MGLLGQVIVLSVHDASKHVQSVCRCFKQTEPQNKMSQQVKYLTQNEKPNFI